MSMNLRLKSANELRRERAVLQDTLTSEASSLAKLWSSLLGSEERIVDAFFTSERCYLILDTNHRDLPPLTGRQHQILERALIGEGQKTIALELGVAPSTVAFHAREALRFIGIDGRPSRCHPLPMLAAIAAVSGAESWSAASSIISGEAPPLRVVSVARPEIMLAPTLPNAELDILGCLVEGLCYVDISLRRQTAVRTVANQISAVFRRFRVSGRNELVCHLMAASMRLSSSSAPPSKVAGVSGVPSPPCSQSA
jgi:DNA-binding NarL/FixJ family response regulator